MVHNVKLNWGRHIERLVISYGQVDADFHADIGN